MRSELQADVWGCNVEEAPGPGSKRPAGSRSLVLDAVVNGDTDPMASLNWKKFKFCSSKPVDSRQ